MDWSRAKTYLILTFLILDLLLGYQYFTARQQAAEYVQSYSTQLQELKDVLKEHKMVLQTEVPKETPVMRFLQVSHPKQTNFEITNGILKNPRLIEDDKSKNTMKFHSDNGEFVVTGDGYFSMTYAPPLQLDTTESTQRLSSVVLQKMASSVWHSEQYSEDRTEQNREHTTIRYVQTYNKYPVFSAVLEVYLQNSQIIGYNQKALDIGSEQENGQRVVSAVNAIRSVTDTLDMKATADQTGMLAVRDIRLGYYSPNYDDADVWYLAPMWRIIIGQNLYYVNAFTGQVENGTS